MGENKYYCKKHEDFIALRLYSNKQQHEQQKVLKKHLVFLSFWFLPDNLSLLVLSVVFRFIKESLQNPEIINKHSSLVSCSQSKTKFTEIYFN